jgi:hypothetical protein
LGYEEPKKSPKLEGGNMGKFVSKYMLQQEVWNPRAASENRGKEEMSMFLIFKFQLGNPQMVMTGDSGSVKELYIKIITS